jgi:uncharacterized protein YkwD
VEFRRSGIFIGGMRRAILFASFVAFVAADVGAQPAAATALPPATTCPGSGAVAASPGAELAAMRCLVEWVRARSGLPPLRELPQLDRSAGIRAAAIRRCGSFSHTPCGQRFVSPFVRVGYLRRNGAVGENLAWGGSALGSPRATLAAWLASPEHRANLLGRWRDCGISLARGRLFGAAGVSLWVLQFGRRA